jgi:Ser/Thr protein kinase RdoA (MazF antagonist)
MQEEVRSLVTTQFAARVARRWNARRASIQSVQQSENFVFRFRDGKGRERYLRVSPPNYRPIGDIEAELDFVRHLKRMKVPVAGPVRSIRGKWVETIQSEQGELYAAVFEAVYGEPMRWGTDQENRGMLLRRGRALGRMHHAARSYHAAGGVRRFHWYEDDLFTDPEGYLSRRDWAARREYEELVQWMLSREATRENYGMVHGDFGSGNTLVRRDGSVVAFDFDDCLHHWYIYDLAISIRTAARFPYRARKRYLAYLLEGYGEEKNLGNDTAREVEQFCRLGALYRYIALRRESDGRRLDAEQGKRLAARLKMVRRPPKWH